MRIKWGLFRIYRRQARLATGVGVLGMVLFTLLEPEVIQARNLIPFFIVLAQCFLLSLSMGRFGTPSFAFLYSRGFSRDALWGHMMLASALSVLSTCLVSGLVIWTGLRAWVLGDLMGKPFFDFFIPREATLPLLWLLWALVIMSAFHYAWIRKAQPTKGGTGGALLAIGLTIAIFEGLHLTRRLDDWFAWLLLPLYFAVVCCLVIGGRILHRSLEVRS